MDVIGKIVQSGSCTADGTVATTRNPLTNMLDTVLQTGSATYAGQPGAASTAEVSQFNSMEMQMRRARDESFQQRQHPAPMPPQFAHPQAQMHAGQWAQEFNQNRPDPRMEQAFAHEGYARTLQQHDMWAQEFKRNGHAPPPPAIMHQMERSWQASHQEVQNREGHLAAEAMVREMSSNPDPRWQNSELLKMMKDLQVGKVKFDQNRVVETQNGDTLNDAWTDSSKGDFNTAWNQSQAGAPGLETAWQESKPAAAPVDFSLEEAWNSSELQDSDLEKIWQRAVEEAQGNSADVFDDVWGQENRQEDVHRLVTRDYAFQEDNPYLEHAHPFEEGIRLFKIGQVTQAILAFEAEVQRNVENSEAWRMLGEGHAEHDDDKKAIACLERAVEQDTYNLDAVLALGVSYVNEVDSHGALKTLKLWVQHNPKFHGLEIRTDAYSDGTLMDEVMQLMLQAEAFDPNDADVQTVLGVLYNVSRDYDAAAAAFQKTVNFRPDQHTLWNKLGATLANNNKSTEAMPAYHRALELKPRYARGWLNLGISHGNLGQYHEAARCYLQALALNPEARHIWSYVRIAFTCVDRFDLVKLADTQDLSLFREEFQLLDL